MVVRTKDNTSYNVESNTIQFKESAIYFKDKYLGWIHINYSLIEEIS